MENRALGKGLSALIPDRVDLSELSAKSSTISQVKTTQVRFNSLQPRINYDQQKLADLIASIKEKGILQPILVREIDGGFEVVAGERRLRAAQALNLEEVPVIVKKLSDQEALIIALIENIQREDLNAIEEAHAFRRLIEDFGLNQNEVAQSVGKDNSTVSNTMRLLKLPQDIQQSVVDAQISMGHARALLAIEDAQEQKEIFNLIVQKGLSVRALENLIKTGLKSATPRRKIKARQHEHELKSIEEDLQLLLGTKVRILPQRKRGKVLIEYYSFDDLERILQIIKK